jgi:hypothetical protein
MSVESNKYNENKKKPDNERKKKKKKKTANCQVANLNELEEFLVI